MPNDKLIELTSEGLKISTKEKIKEYLKSSISEAYGTDINFNPSYPDGILVEALSTTIRDTFESIQGLYNSFNIRNSSGVMLDSLSNLINIHRRKRTQSSGSLTILLEKGINYSWSSLVLKDQNNNLWRNMSTFNLNLTPTEAEDTEVTLRVTCDRFGVVEQPTSFIILSPTNSEGMTVYQTLDSFIQGSFDEDDISLRNRVANTPIYNSSNIKEQLIKKLLENKYVKSVKVYNNDSDAIIELDLMRSGSSVHVTLPVTQLAVIVQYNEELFPENEDKEEIAQIIADYKGLSVITLDPDGQVDEFVEYTYEDSQNPGIDHIVYYIEAQKKENVVVNLNITRGINYNEDTTDSYIKTLVCNYLNTLGVGIDLKVGGLMSYLYDNSDKQFITNNILLTNNISYDEYFPTMVETGYLTINITKD